MPEQDALNLALAGMVQGRVACGEWRVIGVGSLDAMPAHVQEGVIEQFGGDAKRTVIVVIETAAGK